MRMTIVNKDGVMTIDGVTYPIDTTSLAENVHAVQWYDTFGEVEIKDIVTNKMVENRTITSIEEYQPLIDQWNVKDQAAKIVTTPSTPGANSGA